MPLFFLFLNNKIVNENQEIQLNILLILDKHLLLKRF